MAKAKAVGSLLVLLLVTLSGCGHLSVLIGGRGDSAPAAEPAASSAAATATPQPTTTPLARPSARAIDELLAPEGLTLKTRGSLTAGQIEQELKLLRFALEQGYGGRKFVSEASWKQLLRAFERLAAERQTTFSSETFCRAVDSALFAIDDNGLRAFLPTSATTPMPSCNPKRERIPHQLDEGANLAEGLEKPWLIEDRELGGRHIPTLALRELGPSDSKPFAGLGDELNRVLENAKALLIDLRGTTGTDESVPRLIAERLYGAEPPSPESEIVVSQTGAATALALSGARIEEALLRAAGKPVPQELLEKKAKLLAEHEKTLSGTLPPQSTLPRFSRVPSEVKFAAPIYLLIDGGCSGACERFVELMESHPMARTVGQNTAGNLHSSQPGRLLLPFSHVIIEIPAAYVAYADGRVIERVGYAPNYYVSTERDSFDAALEDVAGRLKLGFKPGSGGGKKKKRNRRRR